MFSTKAQTGMLLSEREKLPERKSQEKDKKHLPCYLANLKNREEQNIYTQNTEAIECREVPV